MMGVLLQSRNPRHDWLRIQELQVHSQLMTCHLSPFISLVLRAGRWETYPKHVHILFRIALDFSHCKCAFCKWGKPRVSPIPPTTTPGGAAPVLLSLALLPRPMSGSTLCRAGYTQCMLRMTKSNKILLHKSLRQIFDLNFICFFHTWIPKESQRKTWWCGFNTMSALWCWEKHHSKQTRNMESNISFRLIQGKTWHGHCKQP